MKVSEERKLKKYHVKYQNQERVKDFLKRKDKNF